MNTVYINPQGIEDEYLKGLNLCFANWGDRRTFHWYFQRKTCFPDPDLIVLKDKNRIVAGSAVTYRRVALPNGHDIGVGILTGSWTHPLFRGQGCFTRIIKESLQLTAQKDSSLLLAFTTEENPSMRQLAKAGAALFPSWYFVSTPQTKARAARQLRPIVKSKKTIGRLVQDRAKRNETRCQFVYPTAFAFAAQFVNRPRKTEILSDDLGNSGVIESKDGTEMLQLLITETESEQAIAESVASFHNYALANGQRLFLFSTNPIVARACQELGFGLKPGYLTSIVANESRLRSALSISKNHALKHPSLLASPGNPWFLGPWGVASGDRA